MWICKGTLHRWQKKKINGRQDLLKRHCIVDEVLSVIND